MAKATASKTVTVITLELSEEEAQVIADILSRVGGQPKRSRRGLADDIRAALKSAGVDWQTSPYFKSLYIDDLREGSGLHFADRP